MECGGLSSGRDSEPEQSSRFFRTISWSSLQAWLGWLSGFGRQRSSGPVWRLVFRGRVERLRVGIGREGEQALVPGGRRARRRSAYHGNGCFPLPIRCLFLAVWLTLFQQMADGR